MLERGARWWVSTAWSSPVHDCGRRRFELFATIAFAEVHLLLLLINGLIITLHGDTVLVIPPVVDDRSALRVARVPTRNHYKVRVKRAVAGASPRQKLSKRQVVVTWISPCSHMMLIAALVLRLV